MSREYWKSVLDTAIERLEQLRLRRDELDLEREEVNLEVVQLEQVVENLSPLASETPMLDSDTSQQIKRRVNINLRGVALTEACRIVLQKLDKHMTAIEVRNALEACGYDLSQHANALASIHGVLKRLAESESGDVETIPHDTRGNLYRWKSQGVRVPDHGAGGAGIGSLRTRAASNLAQSALLEMAKLAYEEKKKEEGAEVAYRRPKKTDEEPPKWPKKS